LASIKIKGENKMTIEQVLVWIAGGGCIVAASWLLERFPKYTALASNIKELIFFGVAIVLGGGAYAIGIYVPAEVLAQIAPYFAIVSMVFSYIFLGKGFHSVDKLENRS
jgi:hypothetical protein